jgi:putative glutamine amidotransferase
MKKIAITQRIVKIEPYNEIRDELDLQWARLFKKLNFLPIILPTGNNFESYFKEINIEGIILSGGNNLSQVKPQDKIASTRDNFEKNLIEFAINKKIPLFGVCRGMQIIADFFNTKIYRTKNHAGTRHRIIPQTNSEYHKLLKKIDTVNSYHDYGILDLPEEFVVSANGEDNTIEAFEHKKLPIWGQMWHSERESPSNKVEIQIIKEFFSH